VKMCVVVKMLKYSALPQFFISLSMFAANWPKGTTNMNTLKKSISKCVLRYSACIDHINTSIHLLMDICIFMGNSATMLLSQMTWQ
jgi:hypothetical protein